MLFLRVNHALVTLPLWTVNLSTSASASTSTSACVLMQGNGERFPALLAQVMALLEQDIEPQVIMGGSSASGAASIVRALLENPSLNQTEVLVNGRPLSLAQKAARLLASSTATTSTAIILPSLNTFSKTLLSLGKYLGADKILEAFIGYPDQAIAPVEATVGQTALMVEFYARTDFARALREPLLSKRTKIVSQQWLKFGDHIFVTPREFMRAMMTAPQSSQWTERTEEIKRRYFDLFYDARAAPDQQPEPALEQYNQKLEELSPLLSMIPDAALLQIFNGAMGILKNIPSMSSKSLASAEGFYLVNGSYMRSAYHGRLHDKSGPMPIPSGVLIHATARIASEKGGRLTEKTGLEYLYQAYFPSEDLHQDLVQAQDRLPQGRSFIESTNSLGVVEPLLEKDHLLVLKPRSLARALSASMAEPNAFRRDALELTQYEKRKFGLELDEASLVSYGGWLEHANRRSLDSLDACKKADLLVEVSNLSPALYKFQLKAIRPVIAGGTGSVIGAFTGELEASNEPAKLWTDGLWKAFQESREVRPPEKSLLLDFDWDNASALEGASAEAMNAAYQETKDALFIRAYQDASEKLEEKGLMPEDLSSESILGADLKSVSLKSLVHPSQLAPTVEKIMR